MSRKPKLKALDRGIQKAEPAPAAAPVADQAPPAEAQPSGEALANLDRATRAAREAACAKGVERVLAEYGCHTEVRPKFVPVLRRNADNTERVVFEVTVELEVVAHGRR